MSHDIDGPLSVEEQNGFASPPPHTETCGWPGEDWARVPLVPGDKQLKVFGYAPGNYISQCLGCGQPRDGLDKLASSCRPCAERRYRAIILECAVEPLPAPPEAAVSSDGSDTETGKPQSHARQETVAQDGPRE
jgi:hypothetical protein